MATRPCHTKKQKKKEQEKKKNLQEMHKTPWPHFCQFCIIYVLLPCPVLILQRTAVAARPVCRLEFIRSVFLLARTCSHSRHREVKQNNETKKKKREATSNGFSRNFMQINNVIADEQSTQKKS